MTSCFLPLEMCGRSVILEMTPSPLILSHQSFPTMLEKIKNKTVRRRGHWGALGTSLRRVTTPPFARTVPQGDAGLETSAERPELPVSCPQRRGRKPREGDRPRFSAKRGKKAAGPGALGARSGDPGARGCLEACLPRSHPRLSWGVTYVHQP